jgi:hypothetical protein
LQAAVESSYPGVEVSRLSAGKGTQDAGTIRRIILNAGAVVAVANGIADWLRLRHSIEVKIVCQDGTTVIAKSVSAATAEAVIVAALQDCEKRQVHEVAPEERRTSTA